MHASTFDPGARRCAGATVATMIVGGALAGDAAAQPAEHDHETMQMDHGQPGTALGITDTRNASGTSWQPDSTPMFMWH